MNALKLFINEYKGTIGMYTMPFDKAHVVMRLGLCIVPMKSKQLKFT